MKKAKIVASMLTGLSLCIGVVIVCQCSIELLEQCRETSKTLIRELNANGVQPHRIHFPK